jgi:DedD protein
VASKFQNRLVGTVILVALGVIVLPIMLDGQKKHYEEEFAAIPLMPASNDAHQSDTGVAKPLPASPAAAVDDKRQLAADLNAAKPPGVATPQAPAVLNNAMSNAEQKNAAGKLAPQKVPEVKEALTKPAENAEKAPQGQAYVVQLGALKNAAKVHEIVANLRAAGFRAYTLPGEPVQGQLTRILVGPEASKQKLENALPALQQLTGLSGQVRSYRLAQQG